MQLCSVTLTVIGPAETHQVSKDEHFEDILGKINPRNGGKAEEYTVRIMLNGD